MNQVFGFEDLKSMELVLFAMMNFVGGIGFVWRKIRSLILDIFNLRYILYILVDMLNKWLDIGVWGFGY